MNDHLKRTLLERAGFTKRQIDSARTSAAALRVHKMGIDTGLEQAIQHIEDHMPDDETRAYAIDLVAALRAKAHSR